MKRYSWIGYFVLFPLLMYFGNKIFMGTKNNGTKYTQEYIEKSDNINLDMPSFYDMKVGFGDFITGYWARGNRAAKYGSLTFYNSEYQKYFRLYIFGQFSFRDIGGWHTVLKGKRIKANINGDDLENPKYGTAEKPIPFFMFSMSDYDLVSTGAENMVLSNEQYETAVKLYLTYMLPKEEFKQRFEKGSK